MFRTDRSILVYVPSRDFSIDVLSDQNSVPNSRMDSTVAGKNLILCFPDLHITDIQLSAYQAIAFRTFRSLFVFFIQEPKYLKSSTVSRGNQLTDCSAAKCKFIKIISIVFAFDTRPISRHSLSNSVSNAWAWAMSSERMKSAKSKSARDFAGHLIFVETVWIQAKTPFHQWHSLERSPARWWTGKELEDTS